MSPVGPELPPHLQPKRKRDDYEDSRPGTSSSSSSDSTDKRRRIVGPTLPPAPLDERPPTDATSPNDSSSEDEDGYGPSLPTAEDSTDKSNTHGMEAQTFDERDEKQDMQEKKMSRDEWMMLPPKQDDLAARMDPTKIQARGFSKSKALKGSNAAKDDDKSIWTETPEQKRKRLEYQVLGISEPSSTKTTDPSERRKTAKDDEKKVKMAQEHKVSICILFHSVIDDLSLDSRSTEKEILRSYQSSYEHVVPIYWWILTPGLDISGSAANLAAGEASRQVAP